MREQAGTKTLRGLPYSCRVGSLARWELGQAVADRNPEVQAACFREVVQAKRVRGVPGGSADKAAGGRALEGENPRGVSSQPRSKTPWAARDSRKGQSLEVGARRTGSSVSPMGDRVVLTARGFGERGNALSTL